MTSVSRDFSGRDGLLRAYGEAMLEWTSIEEGICFALGFFAELEDSGILSALFYSYPNFHSRVKATTEVASHFFKDRPELLKEWKEIAQEVRSLASGRNQLAHGVLHLDIPFVGDPARVRLSNHWVGQPRLYPGSASSDRWDEVRIRDLTARFKATDERVWGFLDKIQPCVRQRGSTK